MNRYDTFWRRVGAGFIDALVFVPVGWLGDAFHFDAAGHVVAISWSIILSLTPIVYSVWMHRRFGQTIGKMATGVIVLDVSEERKMTLRQSWMRDIGWIVLTVSDHALELSGAQPSIENPSALTALGAMGFASFIWSALEIVTMLSNDKRRALHDWIAHSVVLRKMPNKAPKPTASGGRGSS